MILLIDVCKEPLHTLEFIKPIEDILKKQGLVFETVHYKAMNQEMVAKAEKIIICGTSLHDNEFLKNLSAFSWIKETEQPILGICAGMQILGMVSGGMLKEKTEIGFYSETFSDLLGISGPQEVFHLHTNYVDFSKLNDFSVYAGENIPQAVKHKKKDHYGVLFHPEVRQKTLVKEFALLNTKTTSHTTNDSL